jgi:molecular chaperone DnaJ
VGVSSGDRVRVAGKGEAGYRGSEAGDLYLIIKIKDHKYLSRDGQDITSTVEIGYFDLLLGSTIDVYTVWGDVEVTIPEFSTPEGKLRLKNQGMPTLNNAANKGDHYINLKVKMPKHLSKDQRKSLEQLREATE